MSNAEAGAGSATELPGTGSVDPEHHAGSEARVPGRALTTRLPER